VTELLRADDLAVSLSPHKSVMLSGLPVFVGHDEQLFDVLDGLLKQGKPCLIVTANVDQAIDLTKSHDLWRAYREASLRTLDGMPLVWMAKLLGASGVTRQTGADMLTKCVAASHTRGWRVVILGGADEANEGAAQNLLAAHPTANLVGLKLPYSTEFDLVELKPSLTLLSELRPDLVFVCLGSPKQEQFFLTLRNVLPPAIYIGAGAAVDFASGHKSRAPRWVQSLGMEWTWRLIQEPRRLAYRYLVKGWAVAIIMKNTLRKMIS
jgi:N-acetylglucosaminyldiphosphoundecaprenol N-acetyl-beta-D-mannosaminyltransferase